MSAVFRPSSFSQKKDEVILNQQTVELVQIHNFPTAERCSISHLYVTLQLSSESCYGIIPFSDNADPCHRRLGIAEKRFFITISKVQTITKTVFGLLLSCHTCNFEKCHKKSCKTHFELVKFAGHVVYFNVFGPLPKIYMDASTEELL